METGLTGKNVDEQGAASHFAALGWRLVSFGGPLQPPWPGARFAVQTTPGSVTGVTDSLASLWAHWEMMARMTLVAEAGIQHVMRIFRAADPTVRERIRSWVTAPVLDECSTVGCLFDQGRQMVEFDCWQDAIIELHPASFDYSWDRVQERLQLLVSQEDALLEKSFLAARLNRAPKPGGWAPARL